MTQPFHSGPNSLLAELRQIVSACNNRVLALQSAADALRRSGGYRWVGLYDVDHANAMVRCIVFSGPGAPEFPTFPIGKGLTSSAISSGKTVNVGDVATDPRYLTAFGSTRSEIIVPVHDATRALVIGTIDIESERANAFDRSAQELLETCAIVLQPLWAA
jgi:L-methionine (R)-S-oxide reductase